MTRRLLMTIATAAAVTIAVGGTAIAHPGHEHKIMGTVTMAAADHVMLKDKDGNLTIISTPNQDPPIMSGFKPLLGVDVWEHAYYLNYQNRRADYLTAWWNTVNWDFVNNQLASE